MSVYGKLLGGASAFVILAATSIAAAQAPEVGAEDAAAEKRSEGLEEITVTAERLKRNLQKVPVAVTALTSKALEERQITSLLDLKQNVPGLTLDRATGVTSGSRIFIRGIGQTTASMQFDPGVAVYVDGVYHPRMTGATFDFYDIERVEVLRGPQGTLFGRNATGGAISIVTRTPSFEPTFSGDVFWGGPFNSIEARGYVSAGLVDDVLAFSVSALARGREGMLTDSRTGEKLNDIDTQAYRGKLRYTPNADFSAELSVNYERDRSDPWVPTSIRPYAFDPNPRARMDRDLTTTEINGQRNNRMDSWGTSLDLNYQINEKTSFRSLTAYKDIRHDYVIPFIPLGPVNVVYVTQNMKDAAFSQEFTFNYETDRLSLVSGVYYYSETASDAQVRNLPVSASTRDTDVIAIYAQGTYNVTSDVSIIGGLRYSNETTESSQQYPTRSFYEKASKSWDSLTPKIGLQWQVTDDFMSYASYTKGFKSGGFNLVPLGTSTGLFPNIGPIAFDPEKVDSYEVGAKLTALDGKLRINSAAYFAEFEGLQLPVFFPGTINSYTSNASDAEVYGLEVEATWRLTPEFQVFGSLSLTGGKYTSPFRCTDERGAIQNCQNAKLKNLIPVQSTLGFLYVPDINIGGGTIRIGGDWTYTSEYEGSTANTPGTQLRALHIVNGFVSYSTPGDHWTISLEGKNLTDEHYYRSALSFANAAGGALVAFPSDPLTWGVRLRASF